ncbi:hypothetical protein LSTR_LSTR016738 [Laodelphax striatellus]|uniref:Uncharacterized protein n=1 Tax=Laodelphax striatellus TaxID=195883 RepID=A0A482XIF8_LAOST|nr:hypothetical protein LSTR_LSTR016738 [Laodelphax striatellus]
MYFQCTIKISPCITKCLENFVLEATELVSKFKQHFSDEPPEGGTVRRVVIHCDDCCDCKLGYSSVGVEKLKEIEKSMRKDSETFIKTKSELLFGNDRGHHLDLKRESGTERRDSNMQTSELKPKSALQEEKNPYTNILIESGIKNAKIKMKIVTSVQGKLNETPTEKGFIDEKQAQNTESATDEEPSPPYQDLIDRNYEENKERIQDDQLKENKLDGNGENSMKSDEIDGLIDIECLENEEQTAKREDSRTESEKNLERESEDDFRPRTTLQLEYQRFINEFGQF